MADDFDVDDFNTTGDFITTAELRTNGPQTKRIASVEKGTGFKDKNGKIQPELVLVFADGRKAGLRAKVNRDEARDGVRQADPRLDRADRRAVLRRRGP